MTRWFHSTMASPGRRPSRWKSRRCCPCRWRRTRSRAGAPSREIDEVVGVLLAKPGAPVTTRPPFQRSGSRMTNCESWFQPWLVLWRRGVGEVAVDLDTGHTARVAACRRVSPAQSAGRCARRRRCRRSSGRRGGRRPAARHRGRAAAAARMARRLRRRREQGRRRPRGRRSSAMSLRSSPSLLLRRERAR